MTPGFHIRRSKLRRRFYVLLIAENGEVLSTSELLNSERTALENIEAQKRTIADHA